MKTLIELVLAISTALFVLVIVHQYVFPIEPLSAYLPSKVLPKTNSLGRGSASLGAKDFYLAYLQKVRNLDSLDGFKEVFPGDEQAHADLNSPMGEMLFESEKELAQKSFGDVTEYGKANQATVRLVFEEQPGLINTKYVFLESEQGRWVIKEHFQKVSNRPHEGTARLYWEAKTFREPASPMSNEVLEPFKIASIPLSDGRKIWFDKKKHSLWAFDQGDYQPSTPGNYRTWVRLFDANKKLIGSQKTVCYHSGSGGSMGFDFNVERVSEIAYFSHRVVDCAGGF